MKIGDRVVLKEKVIMHNKTYYPGHEFTIIGSSGYRGFDLKDDDGNEIYIAGSGCVPKDYAEHIVKLHNASLNVC